MTERAANAGLNVDTSAKLFTVVDLSTVWVVADVYEKDFSHVRVGTPANVTTKAFPDLALNGRVSYIDPQVHPETRTAKVRVEVPNLRQELRLGMFADVSIETGGQASTTRIPRAAVQHVGDRTVVYVADPKQPGRFVEREVRLGDATGNDVVVSEWCTGRRQHRDRWKLFRARRTRSTRHESQRDVAADGCAQPTPHLQEKGAACRKPRFSSPSKGTSRRS